MLPESSFPEVHEATGYWLGVARTVGDVLTYEVLTDDTQCVLTRSVVRPITEGTENQRLTFSRELDPDVQHPPPPYELQFSASPRPIRRDLFQYRRNVRPRKHKGSSKTPSLSQQEPQMHYQLLIWQKDFTQHSQQILL